jgi:hypothetical protein
VCAAVMTARLRLDGHEPPGTTSLERNAGWSDGSTCLFLLFEMVDVPKGRFPRVPGKWLDFNNAAAISPFRSGEFSTQRGSSCADVVDAAVKTTIAPSKSFVENLLMDRSVTVEAQRSLLAGA